jgi:hypothetical protein
MTCPSGYHPRRAYTLKRTGTRVAISCVRATTKAGPRAEFVAKTKRRMTRRLQGHPRSERGVTSCPIGQIVRDAYVRVRRSRRTFVPASCIKDVGNPGKGLPGGQPGIGPLRKGDLKKFGYDNVVSMTVGNRHLALAKAVKANGSLTVWRKLNAIYVYTRNTAPASSVVFKADRDWVKETYGLRAF